MTKLKKIGIWNFAIVFALAFVVYQLVQTVAGYALKPASSYIQSLILAGNTWLITVLQWILVIILPLIAGIMLVIAYNLLARWIGIKIEISGPKKK